MSYLLIRRAGLGLLILLIAVGESGCAAARPLPLLRPANPAAVTNLADLQLQPGTQCLVGLTVARGCVEHARATLAIGSSCGGGMRRAPLNGSAVFLTQTSPSWRES